MFDPIFHLTDCMQGSFTVDTSSYLGIDHLTSFGTDLAN